MTQNTNIKIKFQQKRKTKYIPALLRASQNLVYFKTSELHFTMYLNLKN